MTQIIVEKETQITTTLYVSCARNWGTNSISVQWII